MLAALNRIFSLDLLKKTLLFSLLQVLGGSLFLALCAQISIPFYFSPVPLTAQTFGVMLIGALFGRQKAVWTLITYLAEGACGLPVFAGGSFGLLGMTTGYLIGFVFQAYIVGWFIERQPSFNFRKTLTALLLSCAIQMGLGVLWLSYFVGVTTAFMVGFAPFIIGEVVKALALTTYLKNEKNPNL